MYLLGSVLMISVDFKKLLQVFGSAPWVSGKIQR